MSDQTIRDRMAEVLEKMASEVVYMGSWPKYVLPGHEREALEAGAAALRGVHSDEVEARFAELISTELDHYAQKIAKRVLRKALGGKIAEREQCL